MALIDISEAAKFLSEHDNYIIISHRRPDGDCLGCAAALAAGLRRMGKTAYVFRNVETTAKYLPYVERYFAPDGFTADNIITVDTASESLFPIGAEGYTDSVALCIDHHPSNTGYCNLSCIDGTCAACGEIVYEILMLLNGEIDSEIASLLYIALSTDTGCFAFANTTANTLRIASLLVYAGAPLPELNKKLFRTKPKSRFLIESMIMSGIEFYRGGTVAVVSISRDMMNAAGATEDVMDDIPAIPGSIEGVIVGITLRELESGPTKVSVRTMEAVNANELCAQFDGGGHAMAAGCTIERPLAEAKAMLLKALDDKYPDGTVLAL